MDIQESSFRNALMIREAILQKNHLFRMRTAFNISYFYPQLFKQVITGFSTTEKEQKNATTIKDGYL